MRTKFQTRRVELAPNLAKKTKQLPSIRIGGGREERNTLGRAFRCRRVSSAGGAGAVPRDRPPPRLAVGSRVR
jgi:hypothetical protein